jgi:hypothetical protein
MTLQNGVGGFDSPPQQPEANGTGELAPEADAANGPATLSPSASDEQPPTIEALQAQLTEMKEQAAKRENDYKSLEGRFHSQARETTQNNDLSDKVETLVDVVQALVRRDGSQDPEAFVEDLQKVESNAADRRATNSFQVATQSMIEEITETIQELGLSIDEAPELAAFRDLWAPAFENKDMSGIYAAHAEFNRAMRQMERNRRLQQQEELTRETEAKVKQALEEHGVNTLDLDSSSSIPSSMNGHQLLERMGNSDVSVSRDEIAQAADVLRKQGIRI